MPSESVTCHRDERRLSSAARPRAAVELGHHLRHGVRVLEGPALGGEGRSDAVDDRRATSWAVDAESRSSRRPRTSDRR